MPRISEATRAKRRHHILTSAWRCFALNGFQATSMDDVIAATGMSSSAVYRYFRGKDEIIDATADEGLIRVRDSFAQMVARTPTPTPAQALGAVIARLHELAAEPRNDMTRIAMQTWTEALRRPALRDRTQALFNQSIDHLTELASRWRAEGRLASDADPRDTAVVFFTLMQGAIVYHHLVADLSLHELLGGLSTLGGALTGDALTSAAQRTAPLTGSAGDYPAEQAS